MNSLYHHVVVEYKLLYLVKEIPDFSPSKHCILILLVSWLIGI
jgi:hypothetical protein